MEISDLRPTSLLPTLTNRVEKVLKNNNLISNCQFGVGEYRGTNNVMFSLLQNIYLSISDNHKVVALFCDFAKSFDSVKLCLINLKCLISKILL